MNNQFAPRFCYKCGKPVSPGSNFCAYCGQPFVSLQNVAPTRPSEKKASPVAAFFLALAKCLGYFGFFFGVQLIVTYVAIMVITIIGMGHYDMEGVQDIYMSHFHELNILSGLITIAGFILFFRIRKKSFVKEISLKPLSIASSGAMVIFGVSSQLIIGIFFAIFYAIFLPNTDNTNEQVQMLFETGSVVLQFLNIAVLTGILEEIVFRGLIYTTLKKVINPPLAIFLSSVIFGAAHMNLEQFFYTTLLGILLALVYEKKGTIIAPIIIHMTFNASNFFISYLNFESDLPYFAILFAATGLFLISAGMIFFTNKEQKNSLNFN